MYWRFGMKTSFDPYDLLIQLDVRCQLLEQHCRELQANQLQISELIKDQNKLVRQAQHNNNQLTKAFNDILAMRNLDK
jgi:hypothetical protein